MRNLHIPRHLATGTALGLGLAVVPTTAEAATNVPCTTAALITAISTANGSGGGTLNLAPGCTYTLTTAFNGGDAGLPAITTPITVNADGDTIERSTAASSPSTTARSGAAALPATAVASRTSTPAA